MTELQAFDPVLYSDEENEFFLLHLGEAPVVAIRAATERGVNPRAVRPVLDRVYELNQLEAADGDKWAGIEALKASIRIYQREKAKWAHDKKRSRNAPRFPSLFSYDGKGRPHLGGPGSDSGRVRTYFGPAGERLPFEVSFIPDYTAEWVAPGFTEQSVNSALLKVDPLTNRIECLVPVGESVCGHTESYKADSRSSYNAARARMSKHLRKATAETEAHMELHTNEYGQ